MFHSKINQIGRGKGVLNIAPKLQVKDSGDVEEGAEGRKSRDRANTRLSETRPSMMDMRASQYNNRLRGYLENDRVQIDLSIPKNVQVEQPWFGQDLTETYHLNADWIFKFFRLFSYFLIGVLAYEHFEHWSFTDTTYFIVQTMTTVGYGNLYPTTKKSKFFTMFFIFFGLLLAFSIINDVARFVISSLRSGYKKPKRLNKFQVFVRHFLNLLMWITILIAIVVFGGVVIHLNEGWDMIDSLYFATITVSSVGYGDKNLQKQSSIWFNIFYICIFVAATAICMEKISSFKRHLEKAELWQVLEEIELSSALIETINPTEMKLTKAEYTLHMLQLEGKLDEDSDLKRWYDKFDSWDTNHDGVLSLADLDKRVKGLDRQKALSRLSTSNKSKTTYELFFGSDNVFYQFYAEARDVFLETLRIKKGGEDDHDNEKQNGSVSQSTTSTISSHEAGNGSESSVANPMNNTTTAAGGSGLSGIEKARFLRRASQMALKAQLKEALEMTTIRKENDDNETAYPNVVKVVDDSVV